MTQTDPEYKGKVLQIPRLSCDRIILYGQVVHKVTIEYQKKCKNDSHSWYLSQITERGEMDSIDKIHHRT